MNIYESLLKQFSKTLSYKPVLNGWQEIDESIVLTNGNFLIKTPKVENIVTQNLSNYPSIEKLILDDFHYITVVDYDVNKTLKELNSEKKLNLWTNTQIEQNKNTYFFTKDGKYYKDGLKEDGYCFFNIRILYQVLRFYKGIGCKQVKIFIPKTPYRVIKIISGDTVALIAPIRKSK